MSDTIIQIVKSHLVAGGFDGLVNGEAECGCMLPDLVLCYGDFGPCRPAYRGADPANPRGLLMYASKEAAEASLAETKGAA